MSNTIVNKIKKSVQSGTGLTCLYGSLDSINVQMGDQTEFPVAFFVLLNNGSLDDRSSNYRERVDVAMFFVKPTEFDFESIENEAIISECKQCAFQWLNSLFLGGDLRYITTLNTSRVYNQMDDILTGYALRVRLEELVGECAPEPFKTTCEITATSNDPILGGATGGGVYDKGKPVTLTADFDPNRTSFVSWTVDGVVVSTDPTYTFTAEEDVTVVCNYSSLNYFRMTCVGDLAFVGWQGTYPDLEVRKNGTGEWESFNEQKGIHGGEYLEFRNATGNWAGSNISNHFSFNTRNTTHIELSGNIMSLVYKDIDYNTIPITSCFSYLFLNSLQITNADELCLPASTLVEGCYRSMFGGCTALATTPELTATTLAKDCYTAMFQNCNALTTAPVLPATTLSQYCYKQMFLTCPRLSSITVYFTTWYSNEFWQGWTSGWCGIGTSTVSPTGTFHCPRALPIEYGNNRIPTGWTVEYID